MSVLVRLHALLLVIAALVCAWLTLAAAILDRLVAWVPGGAP